MDQAKATNVSKDRQRKKNETLASEIFGRGRKATPTQNGSHKAGTGGSLASRVGIAKVWQRIHD